MTALGCTRLAPESLTFKNGSSRPHPLPPPPRPRHPQPPRPRGGGPLPGCRGPEGGPVESKHWVSISSTECSMRRKLTTAESTATSSSPSGTPSTSRRQVLCRRSRSRWRGRAWVGWSTSIRGRDQARLHSLWTGRDRTAELNRPYRRRWSHRSAGVQRHVRSHGWRDGGLTSGSNRRKRSATEGAGRALLKKRRLAVR
jgi:hypothetical protein